MRFFFPAVQADLSNNIATPMQAFGRNVARLLSILCLMLPLCATQALAGWDTDVTVPIQEDANAIAMTSYQGGHNEYLKYMYDLLNEKGAGHIKIFAGGGGVILPVEIAELEAYGIEKIYSPDDGRAMGLQGMINDLVKRSDYAVGDVIGWPSLASAACWPC